MLRLKIKAELGRGFDYDDIISLNPSSEELRTLREEVEVIGHWNLFDIDELFSNLERDLNYEDI